MDHCASLLKKSTLWDMYAQDKSEKGRGKFENIQELLSAIDQYAVDHEQPNLVDFLNELIIQTDDRALHESGVQLMTLHSAKGLEFQVVFMVGLEEGLFPHRISIHEAHQLEEERRLCYVGMTRAQQKLFILYAETRRLYGQEHYQRPSRFLQEIPPSCLEEIRTQKNTYAPKKAKKPLQQEAPYQLGDVVNHPTFGTGMVLNIEGNDAHMRVHVKFKDHGSKWLLIQMANLEKV